MFGPKTVARFWILILLVLEKDWTSFKNLQQEDLSITQTVEVHKFNNFVATI